MHDEKYEIIKLRATAYVLREIEKEYPNKSIGNIIQQIESRITTKQKKSNEPKEPKESQGDCRATPGIGGSQKHPV